MLLCAAHVLIVVENVVVVTFYYIARRLLVKGGTLLGDSYDHPQGKLLVMFPRELLEISPRGS